MNRSRLAGMRVSLWLVVIGALCLLPARQAWGLVHLVEPGDTLAGIAQRYYGRIQQERILVAANRLDLQGGMRLVPGMRIEVPTITYYVVEKGDTWATLAQRFLGDIRRADVLSAANRSYPWLTPDAGARIIIPYNLSLLISSEETVVSIAQKYLGDRNKAWMLTRYNDLKKGQLERGTVLLIPMIDIELTDEGQRLAIAYKNMQTDGLTMEHWRQQQRIATEIPVLIADVRGGRYVDAIARANRFIALGALTMPQQAVVYRQLLEAYVALEAQGLAAAACGEWRAADPSATLDSIRLSPKVLAACRRSAK
jgi:hypothetical protein